jgi:hypothetical protein
MKSDINIDYLKTPDEFLKFVKICKGRGREDLATECLRRAFSLMAIESGVSSDVEREFWAMVYAIEHGRAERLGRPSPMNRLKMMVRRHGIKEAIERSVVRYGNDTTGWRDLNKLGLLEMCFESIVLRHKDEFSDECVAVSKRRMKNPPPLSDWQLKS